MRVVFLLLCSVWAGVGCSSQDVYEAVQANRVQECDRLQGREREDCLAQYDMTYEEYERERGKD